MLNAIEIKHFLHFLVDSGVDTPLAAAPTDRRSAKAQDDPLDANALTVTPAPPAPARPVSADNDNRQPATGNLSAAIAEARRLADGAHTLAELEAAVRGFDGCALKQTARNTVFADGRPDAPFMLIGEAPGADEDIQGIPFCGASGKLLDAMLTAAGLTRERNAYITNCLFWRPPGNRTPSDEELAICAPFVEKHIALIAPNILIVLGGTAAKALLNDQRGITRLRGQEFAYKNQYIDKTIHTRALFHPSYLLRQPLQKKTAWFDILSLCDYARQENIL